MLRLQSQIAWMSGGWPEWVKELVCFISPTVVELTKRPKFREERQTSRKKRSKTLILQSIDFTAFQAFLLFFSMLFLVAFWTIQKTARRPLELVFSKDIVF